MKHDSGSNAVITEQGSSASQMTAAKVIGHHFKTTGIALSECPDVWTRLPKHKRPKIMVQYGRPSRSS